MPIKVLYISYDGMTDPLGQSQVLPYLKELSKHGYEFHLVSFEKHEKFVKHKKHIQGICDSAGIKWHPQDYAIEGGLRKTLRQVRKMKKVVRYLHDLHDFKITHCRSYISAMAGLELKRKHGVKMIFDMRGFWADERVDGKLWNLESPIYKRIYNYFKRKEIQYFQEADHTISLTQCGKDEINSWKEFQGEKLNIEVIPCCVDLNLFDPNKISNTEKEELRESLSILTEDHILGYVGSIGTWYMLDEMLDYFKVLKTKNKHSRFLFVTGENPTSILAKAKSKQIDKQDLIITSCLHDQVPLHISLFNESVFFIRSTYSKKASSPTKQGEIMAMGIPLVCNSGVGDTDSIVHKYKSGIVVNEFTEEAYQEAIEKANEFNSESTLKGAQEYFALKEGASRYLKVYKSLHE